MNKTAVEESTSLEQQLNLELKERKPQIRAHFSEISTTVSSSKYIPANSSSVPCERVFSRKQDMLSMQNDPV